MNPPKESSGKPTAIEELTYEQALNELEGIIQDLESDDHTLEQTLAMFERGQALARHCAKLLEEAELKVQELSGDTLVDFDTS
ncbi:MAG: exodeoxyribonuclease VII small subunit [Chloroflexota bacterium]|nr:MAG: exodeoxyribonuclease VII small subunit [Chloroflexota bacterium]